jgi:ABC-type bacteriocin/lantibiotic exporter with double-glycine peptidase domain
MRTVALLVRYFLLLEKLQDKNFQEKRVEIKSEPVFLELIKDESEEQPLVVLVDRYFFDYEIHIPHYVIVERKGENFSVADPWDGEIKTMSPLQLQEAIFGVKYILWWAPTVIKVDSEGKNR